MESAAASELRCEEGGREGTFVSMQSVLATVFWQVHGLP